MKELRGMNFHVLFHFIALASYHSTLRKAVSIMVPVLGKMRHGGKKAMALLMAVLIFLSATVAALTALATSSASAAADDYLYIPVSLYDYKYNNQIENSGAAPDAGTRSGGFPNYLPYGKFNEQIARSGYSVPCTSVIFIMDMARKTLPILKTARTLQTKGTTTRPRSA